MDDYLTTNKAARILGYHPDHLRRLLRDGTIEARKFGRDWMIPRQEVDRIKAMQGPGGRLPKTKKGD